MGVVYYLGDHDFWNRPKRYMYCRTIETIAVIKAATENKGGETDEHRMYRNASSV